MAPNTYSLRRIFDRFFPRKYASVQTEEKKDWDLLPAEQRNEWALRYLAQGELALLQGNLNALSFFEAASQIEPGNPQIWYRQGIAFFEYGSEEGREKSLLLSGKYFKIATQLNPAYFEAYVAWGNTLYQLGRVHDEYHFFSEAKEKYKKALQYAANQPKEVLSELHWDIGLLWAEIAKVSEEAHDLGLAIESFTLASQLTSYHPPEMLKDFGQAYLEMGLLINDARLLGQSVSCLQEALRIAPQYYEGWTALGESYAQIYLNTMDERYVSRACDAYAASVKLSPKDAEVWLDWARILAESGRLCRDEKQLRLSVEKCARAAAIDPNDPAIIAQWVESLSYLGSLSSKLDLLIEAESKILQATDLYPDDPDLWLAYGLCLAAFGDYYDDFEYHEMAIEKLQWGLSMDRTSAEHWHALGTVHCAFAQLLNDPDILERAGKFFARAGDLKPSYPALLFDRAKWALQMSRFSDDLVSIEKAVRDFEFLLQGYKESILHHPEWLFEYASSLECLGSFTSDEFHYQKAIEIFSHVLLIHPDFSGIYQHIAVCYLETGHLTFEEEYYKKAIHFFRLASRHDEENDQIWIDWSICLTYLAQHTSDADFRHQLYWDAEQKINKAGRLGNPYAYYHLACIYSILSRTDEAMELIHKALAAKSLPPLEELAQDEWLENLRATEAFSQFFTLLTEKMQQSREE